MVIIIAGGPPKGFGFGEESSYVVHYSKGAQFKEMPMSAIIHAVDLSVSYFWGLGSPYPDCIGTSRATFRGVTRRTALLAIQFTVLVTSRVTTVEARRISNIFPCNLQSLQARYYTPSPVVIKLART